MKTVIIYAGNQGCVKSVAEKMKEDLGENVVLENLKKGANPSVKEFQRIIIGGSTRSGQIQKRIKVFCDNNLDELLEKETGLFICSMMEEEVAEKQLLNIFPEALYSSAKSTAIFKSGFDYSRMNFLEKMIVRNVKREKHTISRMDYEAVQRFSRRMDRVFNPFLFLA